MWWQVRKVSYWTGVSFIVMMGVVILFHNLKFFTGARSGFLSTKQSGVLENLFYLPAFYAHVATGSLVLILGTLQFRSGKNKWHRRFGIVYIVTILSVTAPAGFIMAIFANGGIVPQISFVTLSLLWWLATFVAWRKILVKDIVAHEVFMYRSFALTLSAVTLRLYTFLAAWLLDLRGQEVYVWVAVLAWVPNLLLAEIMILIARKSRMSVEKRLMNLTNVP